MRSQLMCEPAEYIAVGHNSCHISMCIYHQPMLTGNPVSEIHLTVIGLIALLRYLVPAVWVGGDLGKCGGRD